MIETTMKVERSTRECLKNVARKNQTYDQLINERISCNAAGCEEKGSVEIQVKAGKFGTLTLFVCPKCVRKFT